MQISLGALRRLRLSPNALAAALCLMDCAEDDGRVMMRTADLAAEFGVTPRTMQTAIRELIDAAFMTRIVRGVYQIRVSAVSEERKTSSEERKSVSEPGYVRTTSSSDITEVPDGTSAAPSAEKSTKGITLVRYEDDGQGLAGVGQSETVKAEPRRQRRGVPDLHRSVPREDWTMAFVAKEVNHRLWQWQRRSGKTLAGSQTKNLTQALNTWALDYGVTPQEAATLCDRFFDDTAQTSRLGKNATVTAQFLQYVKVNLQNVRDIVVTDEYRESVMSQELPWA